MGLFKKFKKVLKKAVPIAAGFIPGVGGVAAQLLGSYLQKGDAKRQAAALNRMLLPGAGAAVPAGLSPFGRRLRVRLRRRRPRLRYRLRRRRI